MTDCPRCGQPIVAISSRGPSDHRATCGCRLGAMSVRDLLTDESTPRPLLADGGVDVPRYRCRDCSTSMEVTLTNTDAAFELVARSALSHATTSGHAVDVDVDTTETQPPIHD